GRREVEGAPAGGGAVFEDAALIAADWIAAVVGGGLPLQGDRLVVRLGQDGRRLRRRRRGGDVQRVCVEPIPARPGRVGVPDAFHVHDLVCVGVEVGGLVDGAGRIAVD